MAGGRSAVTGRIFDVVVCLDGETTLIGVGPHLPQVLLGKRADGPQEQVTL